MSEERVSETRSVENIFSRMKIEFKEPPLSEEAQRLVDQRKREAIYNLMVTHRQNWNAPCRQEKCDPLKEGPWFEKMTFINSRLGKGMIIGLVGIRGSGKTQLGVEAMKKATADGNSAYFTTAMQFFMKVKSAYKKDSEEDEFRVVKTFRKPSLLVIDEVGKRGETDWENNLLFELINWRYNDVKDTILIDNRSKQEFIETIGPSLASRMQECGGIIECNWESFRTQP